MAIKIKITEEQLKEMTVEEISKVFLGLKVQTEHGVGYICGNDSENLIVGLKNKKGWSNVYKSDNILKEYKSYWYATNDSIDAIIKYLNK